MSDNIISIESTIAYIFFTIMPLVLRFYSFFISTVVTIVVITFSFFKSK